VNAPSVLGEQIACACLGASVDSVVMMPVVQLFALIVEEFDCSRHFVDIQNQRCHCFH
jgi:hypothetical protein